MFLCQDIFDPATERQRNLDQIARVRHCAGFPPADIILQASDLIGKLLPCQPRSILMRASALSLV